MGILSYGPQTGMSLELVLSDFQWITGYDFPHKLLGYDNSLDCLRRGFSNVSCFPVGRAYYVKKNREYVLYDPFNPEFDWN